ncbi:MAG: hypothetical protein AB7I79_12295 [Rhizobiaceae bacterium]
MNPNALVPIIGIAIVNGIFSPAVIFVTAGYFIWYPGWLPTHVEFVYMASALVVSTLTLMISGVPAALYERFAAAPQPHVTGTIWLAAAALISLPAVPTVLAALGLSG